VIDVAAFAVLAALALAPARAGLCRVKTALLDVDDEAAVPLARPRSPSPP
jgi:hypothetical protein